MASRRADTEAFRRAVALDPGNDGARKNLAEALERLKGGR